MTNKKITGKALVAAFALLTLGGCATVQAPTRGEMQAATYGRIVGKIELENAVRYRMEFFDPYSAVINCTTPRKGWASYDYKPIYGSLAQCRYNAKNRLGGYVGEKLQTFIMSASVLYPIRENEWKYLD